HVCGGSRSRRAAGGAGPARSSRDRRERDCNTGGCGTHGRRRRGSRAGGHVGGGECRSSECGGEAGRRTKEGASVREECGVDEIRNAERGMRNGSAARG